MWAGISGSVGVCRAFLWARCQVNMCEADWENACMCRFAWICGGVSRPSPLGESRVEHGSSRVEWSDAYPVQQRRHGLSSQSDHRNVFRWAQRSIGVLRFHGRPQQGLNVCGAVSHSVSLSFTTVSFRGPLEDEEECLMRQIHHLTHQKEAQHFG